MGLEIRGVSIYPKAPNWKVCVLRARDVDSAPLWLRCGVLDLGVSKA